MKLGLCGRLCGVALIVLLFSTARVWAQAGQSGAIAGQVLDPSGAVVTGASVTLTDDNTGLQRSTTTNSTGRYEFPNLPPSHYDITVTKSGFEAAKVAAQDVVLGNQTNVNIKLEVGASTQTVEVTSVAGAELQTTSAQEGSAIAGDELQNMPNVGSYRDVTNLVQYQADTTSGGMVAGASADQNSFKLDGGDNTDDLAGDPGEYSVAFSGFGSGVVPTPVESVDEIRVSTSGQNADFGSSGGGEIQLSTKRGNNSFHGAAYDYFQGQWLNANSWSNDSTGTAKPISHQNIPGAAIGGPISPMGKMLGGKTYFYVNWEARFYPQASTPEYSVPTPALDQGIITLKNSAGTPIQWNLKSSLACGPSGNNACDPRGLGLDPDIGYVWNNLLPAPNDPTGGDTLNTQGWKTNLVYPTHANFLVERIDHDFGSNWHLMISHRWYDLVNPTTNQVDIGGVIPGDTKGVATPLAPRPAQPDYFVTGLTASLSPTVNNAFHFNYVRNWWQWTDYPYAPINGLPDGNLNANLEIGGQSAGVGLEPINVNNQSVRERFWNGHDWNYTDDLTWLKGNHVIQIGGAFRHWWIHHQRDDNGSTFNTAFTDNIEQDAGLNFPNLYEPETCPTGASASAVCIPSGSDASWQSLYVDVLGITGTSGLMYSRGGTALTLEPVGTPLNDFDIIDASNAYITDSWHIRPSLTLNYGLNYGVSLPPYETSGAQISAVDSSGNLLYASQYLATRESDALQGIPYSPVTGFEQVRDIGSGLKYPYNIDWGDIGPHLSVAWNPTFNGGLLQTIFGHNNTVIRSGYSRIFNRQNGVDLVLVPLLGLGFGQVATCSGLNTSGVCTGLNALTDPTNAFRIGTDGNTIPITGITSSFPQPAFPGQGSPQAPAGVSLNTPITGDVQVLDPGFKTGYQDEINFSIQRQLPGGMLLDLAYVYDAGRNLQYSVDPDSVPYMMTQGGQTFASAYAYLANAELSGESASALTAQPFWEAALGGPGSAYCTVVTSGQPKPGNCTQAVFEQQATQIKELGVVALWTDLDEPEKSIGNKIPFQFGPDLQEIYQYGSNTFVTSDGWEDYDAGSVSLNKRAAHGLTMEANLTWAKEFSTVGTTLQANDDDDYIDPWNLNNDKSLITSLPPLTFNLIGNWNLPFGTGTKGWMYNLVGGWSLAPILTWNNGTYIRATDTPSGGSPFGGCNDVCAGATSITAVMTQPVSTILSANGGGHDTIISSGSTTQYGSNGFGTTNAKGITYFTNPAGAAADFRPCILGQDGDCMDALLPGIQSWNMNLSVVKDVRIWENVGTTLSAQATNVFNHATYGNPGTLSLTSTSGFGVVSGATSGRTIELGIRMHW